MRFERLSPSLLVQQSQCQAAIIHCIVRGHPQLRPATEVVPCLDEPGKVVQPGTNSPAAMIYHAYTLTAAAVTRNKYGTTNPVPKHLC